jgi:predicted enzyme related to lactoylglutathione lyase
MAYLPGKFVWFECITPDPRRAQAFYAEVLGWKVTPMNMGDRTYDMIALGERPIGGYIKADAGARPYWRACLSVADVDAATREAAAAGAKILEQPFDMPTVGRIATIADPQGAVVRLFRDANEDPADDEGTVGNFLWNELHVRDAAKGVAFYERIAGYKHSDMPSPDGTYHVLEANGVGRAGVTSAGASEQGAWLPYVQVASTDDTVARALKHGGKQLVPPSDIPGIGRFAVFADPTGTELAVMKPAPR